LSGSQGAEQAAQLIGPQIGVSPSIIYGQFIAEDGQSLDPAGSYNYGNLQPGGQEASYSSVGAFVQAFVQTIKDNFSGALNAGDNSQAYAAGLFPANAPAYEQGVSQSAYTANIAAGASEMSGNTSTSSNSSNGSLYDNIMSDLSNATGGAVMNNQQAATAQSQIQTPSPIGTLASFLGITVSFYDIGLIFIGAILVLGSIFFISKPAVQSVTVQAAKLAAKVAS
jgi:hypothetical protein